METIHPFTLFWQILNIVCVILLIISVVRFFRKRSKSRKTVPQNPEPQLQEMVHKSLCEVLTEHRTRCSMTQEFVAEAMGVSRQAVSKWENGTSDPSTSHLLKLSELYGVAPEELIRSIRSE